MKNETQCYMTQPSVLPMTLPKGTRSIGGSTADSEPELFFGNGYIGNWISEGAVSDIGRTIGRHGVLPARQIDWSTVPVQEPLDGELRIAPGEATQELEPVAETCRECSCPERPVLATVGELCAYCDRRRNGQTEDVIGRVMTGPGAYDGARRAARARNEAALEADRPKSTRASRELAKPHPWSCDSGAGWED